MYSITMKNVGFGDCFLIKNGDETLVVDCGTRAKPDSKYPQLKNIANEIACKAKENNYSALITHFHADHISGFKKMEKENSKIFSKFYVPGIIKLGKKDFIIYKMEINIFFIYDLRNKKWDSSTAELKSFQFVDKLAQEIVFLKAGDKFSIGNASYEVLWPDWRIIKYEELLKLYDIMESVIKNELKDKYEDFYVIKESILNSIDEWYQNNRGVVERMKEELLRLSKLKYECKKEREKIIEQIDEDEIHISLNEAVNGTSIVFHDKKILMLGDVLSSIIEILSLKEYYDVVKIPHHGTASHYSSLLTKKCDTAFISTKKRDNYGNISESYVNHFLNCSLIVCTNGDENCEYKKNNNRCGVCRCESCTVYL